MAWIVLIVSGLLEAGWALSMKASDGFTRLWPTVSFAVLSWALRSLPVGVAYGVWVGVGAAATAILAILWLGESVSVLKIVSLVLIVAGVVGLNLPGAGH